MGHGDLDNMIIKVFLIHLHDDKAFSIV